MNALHLENVSLSDMQNLRTVFQSLTPDDKDSLPNRDNLLQQLQMQLSQREKSFSELFFAFLKSKFNFDHFGKKGHSHN